MFSSPNTSPTSKPPPVGNTSAAVDWPDSTIGSGCSAPSSWRYSKPTASPSGP